MQVAALPHPHLTMFSRGMLYVRLGITLLRGGFFQENQQENRNPVWGADFEPKAHTLPPVRARAPLCRVFAGASRLAQDTAQHIMKHFEETSRQSGSRVGSWGAGCNPKS